LHSSSAHTCKGIRGISGKVTIYLNKVARLLGTCFLPSALAHFDFAWFANAHCWLALIRRIVRAKPNCKVNLELPLQSGVGISFYDRLNFI
jgi:hypothetical protein